MERTVTPGWRLRAFGLDVASRIELPGARAGAPSSRPDVVLSRVSPDELTSAWSGPEGDPVWRTVIDGAPFVLWAGRSGDHLMKWGEAGFHLTAAADLLACAVTDPGDAMWQRQLMDTVLHTTALIRGADALHASAVEIDGSAVAIAAVSGGGKTTLASELVRRGRPLVADDVVVIRRGSGGILADPGPPLMNLPAARVDAVAAGIPMQPIAHLGDEVWAEVGNAATGALPLGAIWLLERGPGLETGAERIPASPLPLVGHTLVMANRPDRDRHLFEILGDVAQAVALYRLRAGPEAGPERLADIVEGMSARVGEPK